MNVNKVILVTFFIFNVLGLFESVSLTELERESRAQELGKFLFWFLQFSV